jgi:NADH dehydrogenase/putative oxidoreductase
MGSFLAIGFGIFILLGLFTSIVSYFLLFTGITTVVMGVHPDVFLYPLLLLGVYEAKGPGRLSLDGLIDNWLEKNIFFDRNPGDIPNDWPHIVVIGAGFGGLAATNRLKHLPVRVTLLDKRNYHLFQPLLYQIASATLSPSDIAIAIRALFRKDGNVTVIKSEVTDIDPDSKIVRHGDGEHLAYDQLVVATGAQHSYFGRDEWSTFAPGLKTIEDGVAVRRTVLNAFEQAERTSDQERIARLLNFVIVGAGPTGVELAGAIAELSRETIKRDFRTFDPSKARVILVQSGDRVLPTFPEELSAKAEESLAQLGVEVRTRSRVTKIESDHVAVGEELIETETVLWAAGVAASPASQWLGCEADRAGRVLVDKHLRIPAHDNVFVIGDTASANAWDGKPVPGLAPAAKQAGIYVAKVIEAELLGSQLPAPFVYKHQGSLATIGRSSAVADFGFFRLAGAPAWWLWGVVHVGFLAGARNRASVVLNWLWSYFAYQSSARLITGD